MSDSSLEIEALIVLAHSDLQVLGQLLELHRPLLLRTAERWLESKPSARVDPEDVVQETFREAAGAFQAFRGTTERAFVAWLKRIHGNNLVDALRRSAFEVSAPIRPFESPGSTAPSGLDPTDPGSSPSKHFAGEERFLRLMAMVQSLPGLQGEAVWMHVVLEMSVQEVADALDRSLPATSGYIKRGLKTLRSKMSEQSWLEKT